MTSVTPADHDGLFASFAILEFGAENEQTRQLVPYAGRAYK